MLTGKTCTVMIDGNETLPFNIERGVPQVDTASPYLFILVLEILLLRILLDDNLTKIKLAHQTYNKVQEEWHHEEPWERDGWARLGWPQDREPDHERVQNEPREREDQDEVRHEGHDPQGQGRGLEQGLATGSQDHETVVSI